MENQKPLLPIKNPNVSRQRQFVETWIQDKIRKDKAKGRTQNDFPIDGLMEKIKADREKLGEDKVDLYYGAGNIFYVVYKPDYPIVIQIRPLAQRVVRLVF